MLPKSEYDFAIQSSYYLAAFYEDWYKTIE